MYSPGWLVKTNGTKCKILQSPRLNSTKRPEILTVKIRNFQGAHVLNNLSLAAPNTRMVRQNIGYEITNVQEYEIKGLLKRGKMISKKMSPDFF